MHAAHRLAALLAAITTSAPALATTVNPVSEPGILGLLAAGVVAGVVVWVRNRRK